LGAYTGTASYIEDRRVVIDLSATPTLVSQLDDLVPVTLVNRSRRAIVLRRGEVLLEGRKVGSIDFVTKVERPLDISAILRDPEREGEPLPITISGDTTLRLRASWRQSQKQSGFVSR
jgi:hypothetical protein